MIVSLADGEYQRRIPSAFLRRSESLRATLVELDDSKTNKKARKNKRRSPCCYDGYNIRMDDVDVATFEHFFEWSLMLQPVLKESWTLEQILSLAQLSQTYEVFALKNQVASRLRECLMNKRWEVTPDLARELWCISRGQCDRWLGSLLRLSLGAIPKDADRSAWSTLMKDHVGLYAVHSEACLYGYSLGSMKRMDVCEFHDHTWHEREARSGLEIHEGECAALTAQECYPGHWAWVGDEGVRVLCRYHEGGEMVFGDDWQSVVQCDSSAIHSN